jgi:hypothetical protein
LNDDDPNVAYTMHNARRHISAADHLHDQIIEGTASKGAERSFTRHIALAHVHLELLAELRAAKAEARAERALETFRQRQDESVLDRAERVLAVRQAEHVEDIATALAGPGDDEESEGPGDMRDSLAEYEAGRRSRPKAESGPHCGHCPRYCQRTHDHPCSLCMMMEQA